ncbi:MAG TPA: NADH-quinone oxidoreductase subunit C [Candidatus Omnitrophota bacterium]|nr:NADH-quinone oxidoreductase subunit C [Candidatus Omnitrophota bacterium]HPS20867.1 NADH-quinone oxidoreductase subunit C [Candidatus Omnitrophota bacterium]
MADETKIKEELESKFGYLKDKTVLKRDRRIYVDINAENFHEVFQYIAKNMHFNALPAVIGLDEGATFGIIYVLCKDGSVLLDLKVHLDKSDPEIESVSKYFLSADAYERELTDLLGIRVKGLPNGPRYPLPDDWPAGEYPLRKDWKGSRCEVSEGDNNA